MSRSTHFWQNPHDGISLYYISNIYLKLNEIARKVAELPNMGPKGVKNEQFFEPLAGHKCPHEVVIFAKV